MILEYQSQRKMQLRWKVLLCCLVASVALAEDTPDNEEAGFVNPVRETSMKTKDDGLHGLTSKPLEREESLKLKVSHLHAKRDLRTLKKPDRCLSWNCNDRKVANVLEVEKHSPEESEDENLGNPDSVHSRLNGEEEEREIVSEENAKTVRSKNEALGNPATENLGRAGNQEGSEHDIIRNSESDHSSPKKGKEEENESVGEEEDKAERSEDEELGNSEMKEGRRQHKEVEKEKEEIDHEKRTAELENHTPSRRCMSWDCRREAKRSTTRESEGTTLHREKLDPISELRSKRCMPWSCRKHKRNIIAGLNFRKEERRQPENRSRKRNKAAAKRCISWKCNGKAASKRSGEKQVENKLVEDKRFENEEPNTKKCLSWRCSGKREFLVKKVEHLEKEKRLMNEDERNPGCLTWECNARDSGPTFEDRQDETKHQNNAGEAEKRSGKAKTRRCITRSCTLAMSTRRELVEKQTQQNNVVSGIDETGRKEGCLAWECKRQNLLEWRTVNDDAAKKRALGRIRRFIPV